MRALYLFTKIRDFRYRHVSVRVSTNFVGEEVADPEQDFLSKATHWGVDPAFRSLVIADRFPATTDFVGGVTRANLSVPGTSQKFSVFGYPAGFDAGRDLWYSDIQMKSTSYFPFVRLALARYQPQSVTDAHLSSVVVADFSQLTPDRHVTIIHKSPTKKTVQVTGPSFNLQSGRTGPRVRVTVERQNQNTDLGWSAFGSPTTLPRTNSNVNSSSWSGDVTVLSSAGGFFGLGPAIKQRLVIEEFEVHNIGTSPTSTQTAERLVFSDIVPL